MAESPAKKVFDIDDLEVTVRELTVESVRALLLPTVWPEEPTPEQVAEINLDLGLFEECRLSDLQVMTSLTAAQIRALRPSQIKQVVRACKEMNADFFAMLERQHKLRRSA